MKVYIVTRTCNEYNQLGEYFVCWVGAPGEAMIYCSYVITVLDSILKYDDTITLVREGSVKKDSFTTFYLKEYKEGEILPPPN